jgi:hypothetical protein
LAPAHTVQTLIIQHPELGSDAMTADKGIPRHLHKCCVTVACDETGIAGADGHGAPIAPGIR